VLLDNRNVSEIRPLPAPRDLVRNLAASPDAREHIARTRDSIRDVLHGRDRRFVVVVGPCSIHDPSSALEYAERLVPVAERAADRLIVVMRTYFEKPRTTVGWKGFLHDPALDGRCDLASGIESARALLVELAEVGVACGGEALDPVTPQYLGDLLCWAAIGARTCESQSHRELASGLSVPVGFKNPTSGDVAVAVNALVSARSPHTFLGVDPSGAVSAVRTRGNPDVHLILRGGADGPNFDEASIEQAAESASALGLARAVMVDCSHGNSGKDYTRQVFVCRDMIARLRSGSGALMGLMLESHLRPGAQAWSPGARLERGVSITDECIGWEETEKLLGEIAEAVG
jgi:3-deoxy-7-phosphoheptulonate synthase